MPPIGETLREARMRQKLDIADVEERTKIRAKYLRALENEEWGLLPGPDVRQDLPAHLRRGRSASTPTCWSRSTALSTSARRAAGAPAAGSARPPAPARPRGGARPQQRPPRRAGLVVGRA